LSNTANGNGIFIFAALLANKRKNMVPVPRYFAEAFQYAAGLNRLDFRQRCAFLEDTRQAGDVKEAVR
jgi:hypothetical protein